jgi:hypothetical protein
VKPPPAVKVPCAASRREGVLRLRRRTAALPSPPLQLRFGKFISGRRCSAAACHPLLGHPF